MIIYLAYISKHNSNFENQIIILMIPNGKRWYYLAVKKSSALREIRSNHVGDFYCLNCLHLVRAKSKLEFHKKVCQNKDFCGVQSIEFNQCQKSDKAPSFIYADLESLIKRLDGCQNSFEKSSTTKVVENIPCRYSVSTVWTYDGIENKHNVYRCIQR